MKITYIAHPVSGDVKGNIKKILEIVRDINLSEPNVVPFVPYMADLLALNDSIQFERNRGIKNDIAILKSGMVDEIRLYGNKISHGMREEINLGLSLGIRIVPKTIETQSEL